MIARHLRHLRLSLQMAFVGFGIATTCAYALPNNVTQGVSVEGVTEYKLNNGLTVLLAADPSQPSTTVNMTYLVGSRHENYGQTGMAHLLEHMMFRGTPTLANALGEFSKRGLAANGTTSSDRTNYYATFAANSDTLNWYLDWQADTMVNATISRADLDAEMTVVRNEMESGENSPFRILMQKMQASAYQWHNYGKSTIGARSDVENVDIAQLRNFYHEYYQPDNAILIVSGQFDVDATLEHIAKRFSEIPKPSRQLPPEYTVEPTQDGPRQVTLKRQGGSPIVAAQYHIPAASALEFIPLSIGVSALGDTPSGRLYTELVDKNLATSVFGFAIDSKEPSYAFFGAELQDGMNQNAALQALNNAIENNITEALNDEAVNRIRNKWLNSWAKTYADPSSLASALSENSASGDWRLFFLQRDQVEALKSADVQDAVSRWLVTDNRTNGLYIPTEKPVRAPSEATYNLAERLLGYTGKESELLVNSFDTSPQNIEQQTQRSTLVLPDELGDVHVALLPKATRGNRVDALLNVRFGSADELKGSREIADATASLLSRGTKSLSRQNIADQFTQLQADVSFSGGSTGVNVRISTLNENLVPVLSLALEILREANFPESEVEQYKQQVLTYYQNAQTEPSSLASLALARHDNPWSPEDIRYTPTFEESIEEVEELSAADLIAFHNRFYGTGNIRFTAVGSFDEEAVRKTLSRDLAKWKKAPAYERVDNPYREVNSELFLIDTPDKANAFYLATQPIALQDDSPDFAALTLANYMFGQSETSRLWNRVRVKEGLSYDVRSSLNASSYEPNGSITIHAIFAPENSARLQQVINEELNLVLEEGFSEAEVQESIQALLRYRDLARGQDGVLVNTWSRYLDLGRDFLWSAQFDEQLQALNADKVNTALRNYVQADNFSIAIAADESKQQPTAEGDAALTAQ